MFCKKCGTEVRLGVKFCKNCGEELSIGRFHIWKSQFFHWAKNQKTGIFIISGIALLVIIFAVADYSPGTSAPSSNNQLITYDQIEVASSVVNIICPNTENEDEGSGGSGTIISEDGLILTNSHVIPQDEEFILTGDEGCVVVLPDPETGFPSEIYYGDPIVIPGLSDEYDIAFVDIYDVYYDDETGETRGEWPKIFPYYDANAYVCENETTQLGESLRIYGYPSISGGYTLTITEGLVSSFSGDGLIITSAKISLGNSGGLAVDKDGCMIGIPTFVNSDEFESLGVIVPTGLIIEFIDEYLELP